ncbi:hypothetical protein B0H12DRAFT_782138 [Mycena haematopus]|nr:hypothetical protein B0H12DRAFT_782138 [Mycena haematopus]
MRDVHASSSSRILLLMLLQLYLRCLGIGHYRCFARFTSPHWRAGLAIHSFASLFRHSLRCALVSSQGNESGCGRDTLLSAIFFASSFVAMLVTPEPCLRIGSVLASWALQWGILAPPPLLHLAFCLSTAILGVKARGDVDAGDVPRPSGPSLGTSMPTLRWPWLLVHVTSTPVARPPYTSFDGPCGHRKHMFPGTDDLPSYNARCEPARSRPTSSSDPPDAESDIASSVCVDIPASFLVRMPSALHTPAVRRRSAGCERARSCANSPSLTHRTTSLFLAGRCGAGCTFRVAKSISSTLARPTLALPTLARRPSRVATDPPAHTDGRPR